MKQSNTDTDGTDRPDWHGAYAPAKHIRDAIGGISYSGEKEVEDMAVAGTKSGKVIIDADTVAGDTVRLVYDEQTLKEILRAITSEP